MLNRKQHGDPRVRMRQCLAVSLLLMASACPRWAAAQSPDPLPPQTQLVAVTGAPAATEETFTIAAVASGSTQPDLVVTFTDFQTPAPLSFREHRRHAGVRNRRPDGARAGDRADDSGTDRDPGLARRGRAVHLTRDRHTERRVRVWDLQCLRRPQGNADRLYRRCLPRRECDRAIGAGESDGHDIQCQRDRGHSGRLYVHLPGRSISGGIADPDLRAVSGQSDHCGADTRLPGDAHFEPRHLSAVRGGAGGRDGAGRVVRYRRNGSRGSFLAWHCVSGRPAGSRFAGEQSDGSVADAQSHGFPVSGRAHERERPGHVGWRKTSERLGHRRLFQFHRPCGSAAGVDHWRGRSGERRGNRGWHL